MDHIFEHRLTWNLKNNLKYTRMTNIIIIFLLLMINYDFRPHV